MSSNDEIFISVNNDNLINMNNVNDFNISNIEIQFGRNEGLSASGVKNVHIINVNLTNNMGRNGISLDATNSEIINS